MVDASLQHAAAMSMRGNLDEMLCDGIINELILLGCETIQALLDNMVAV